MRAKYGFSSFYLIFLILLLPSCAVPSISELPPTCTPQLEVDRTFGELGIMSQSALPQVAAVVFAPDGKNLLAAYAFASESQPGQLVFLRIPDTLPLRLLALGYLDLNRTRISGDAKFIVTEAGEQRITLWATENGEFLAKRPGLPRGLSDVAISYDGKWVIDSRAVLSPFTDSGAAWPFVEIEEPFTGHIYHSDSTTATINPAGNLIAHDWVFTEVMTGDYYTRVAIATWDGSKLQEVDELDLGKDKPRRLAFDPQSKWLAVQTDRYIRLVPARTNLLARFLSLDIRQVSLPQPSTSPPVFNPSSSLLAVGYQNGIRVLRVSDLKTLIDQPSAAVTGIAFSPEGCLLAWGDVEGRVHIINAPTP
jgi:WD40 repeat protein